MIIDPADRLAPPAPPAAPAGEVELYGPNGAPPRPARRVSGRNRRRLVIGLLAALGLAGAAAGVGLLKGRGPHPVVAGDAKPSGDEESAADRPTAVKAVRPKRDPSFRVSNQQLATVEPFYQAGLRARASGVVRTVTRALGEPVRAGELLADIDVPDLEESVAQKDAVISQRLREVGGAEAEVEGAKALVDVARAAVRQREAEVTQADSTRAFKQKRYDRIRVLGTGGSVTPDVVDEAELDARAAAAAVESARAAVEKAKADVSDKEASLKRAAADVEIKRALVDVARQDREVAAAYFGYARVYAPFDGVLTRRAVDPGVFVQNATTGASEPLLTVARVDLLTVVMRLPDAAAAGLGPRTEAEIVFDQLPGVVVRGPVTRFSPAINPADRTVRIEVDVYNGTAAGYGRLLAREAAETTLPGLVPGGGLGAVGAMAAGWVRNQAQHKGGGPALIPEWGEDGRHARRIAPGMTGNMRVYLDDFTNAHLLPAGAVFTRGGQPCVMLVENGRTKTVPVSVQVNDGRLAKVALLATVGGRQVARELTGTEVVVLTRQTEVGDDRPVEPVFQSW